MSGNYTGNESSRTVKLPTAVLEVTNIACARNSHLNIPTDPRFYIPHDHKSSDSHAGY